MDSRCDAPALPGGRLVRLAERGTTWIWDTGGPPGAPTVILIHGWMATAALNWYPALERLPRSFRVIAPDQRGHGRGIQGGRFSLEDCADDMAALIQELDLRDVVVVGYSMGGAVVQLLARRHPEVISGIVLCATAASFAGRLWLRPGIRMAGHVLSGIANSLPSSLRASAVRKLVRDQRVPTAFGSWATTERAPSDPAAYLMAGVALNRYDATAWLRDLDVPTAVLLTTRDTVVLAERQHALADAIPGARRYLLDAGHGACIDTAEDFVALLAQACSDVAERAAASRSTSA